MNSRTRTRFGLVWIQKWKFVFQKLEEFLDYLWNYYIIYIYIYIYIYLCVCVCVRACNVYMYVCMHVCLYLYLDIVAFTKFRKATISFVISVRPSTFGSHWKDFHEIWYLSILRKYAEKIHVSLKSYKTILYFTYRRKHWMAISRWSLLAMKNVSKS